MYSFGGLTFKSSKGIWSGLRAANPTHMKRGDSRKLFQLSAESYVKRKGENSKYGNTY